MSCGTCSQILNVRYPGFVGFPTVDSHDRSSEKNLKCHALSLDGVTGVRSRNSQTTREKNRRDISESSWLSLNSDDRKDTGLG